MTLFPVEQQVLICARPPVLRIPDVHSKFPFSRFRPLFSNAVSKAHNPTDDVLPAPLLVVTGAWLPAIANFPRLVDCFLAPHKNRGAFRLCLLKYRHARD